jgi:hypothetical protein
VEAAIHGKNLLDNIHKEDQLGGGNARLQEEVHNNA